MRKVILLLALLAGTVSHSQDAIDKIAKETCECIDAKKLDIEKISSSQLQSEFISCFFGQYSKYAEDLNAKEKIDIGDEEAMEKFGEKVAFKMLNHCPTFLLELGKDAIANEEVVESANLEGEIIEIKTGEFVTILVKDKNSRIHSFLFLNYFETASLFTNNEIKKKDKVIVDYSEVELYDTKVKDFRYFKVITGLQKK